ncbi:response regulator [Pedobacter antarcticus]|uniref:response regulator n=1 Tax=Pedobacter antarcticus TaxID=34086 RepID=UPI001C57F9EB|nr:response regulator [Pedobacter antarcticus]
MKSTTIRNIVIVDDNLIYQRIISYSLKQNCYNILFQAENGKDCLEQLQQSILLPDLIILDLDMPVMNGYDTAIHLKARWPAIKIIAYSSTEDPKAFQKIITNGADHFVSKGNDIQELIRKIAQLIIPEINENIHNGCRKV